ncbi:MAG TPA: siroheme synthase, partial [Methylocella sp.]|nr:siroheme synthase [Methylocella sp.]
MNELFSTQEVKQEVEEESSPLMRDLACLPVFFSLNGKKVILAGGSNAILWKAELCQAAGARLEIFCITFCPGLEALAGRCPDVALVSRGIEPEDFY